MAGFRNDVMYADNVDFSGGDPVQAKVTEDGQLLIGSGVAPHIRVGKLQSTGGTITITNTAGGINLESAGGSSGIEILAGDSGTATGSTVNISGLGETITAASGDTVTIFSPRTAQFVVDPTLDYGTHQTITAALAAASSGDTIFVRPGTYTEDLTLKAGVTLIGDTSYISGTVITGNHTFTSTGTTIIANMQLTAGNTALLTVSGSNLCTVVLNNCRLNVTSGPGFVLSNTQASSTIRCYYCTGNLSGANAFHNISNAGEIWYEFCTIDNTSSTTAATMNGTSSSAVRIRNSHIELVLSAATGLIEATNSSFEFATTNPIQLTSTSSALLSNCTISSGSSECISYSSSGTLTIRNCSLTSSATDAITGSGTNLSISGVRNGIVFGDNVDFSGGKTISDQITADGQLLIGSTSAPNIRVGTLASADGSVTITNGAGTIDLSASGGGVKITRFTSSGTWTKDANAKSVRIIGWAGGSGGGSGRRGAISTNRSGGGGGCMSGCFHYFTDASAFGASESVSVGAGGTGGAAITTNDTNGNNGNEGGNTQVGDIETVDFFNRGEGGGTTSGAAGGRCFFFTESMLDKTQTGGGAGSSGAGGNGVAQPLDGFVGGTLAPGGGGGGGGVSSGNISSSGGNGGNIAFGGSTIIAGGTGGGAPSGAGGNGNPGGTSVTSGGYIASGTGGGGGAGNEAGAGGDGGDGAIPGGGGGGGGASFNGSNSGAGGDGARGEVWIYEYLG